MNRRQAVKKRGFKDSELWNFDHTICEFMIPRLKRFKKVNIAYPGRPPYDTFEKWQDAIDKIIHAFDLANKDPLDTKDWNLQDKNEYQEYLDLCNQWDSEIKEGLHIFADNFKNLWI